MPGIRGIGCRRDQEGTDHATPNSTRPADASRVVPDRPVGAARGGPAGAVGAGPRGHPGPDGGAAGVPEPNLVWKDTVLVRTGQVVDILFDVSNPGLWMAHCHIAEHMQSGMMFSFNVARTPEAAR